MLRRAEPDPRVASVSKDRESADEPNVPVAQPVDKFRTIEKHLEAIGEYRTATDRLSARGSARTSREPSRASSPVRATSLATSPRVPAAKSPPKPADLEKDLEGGIRSMLNGAVQGQVDVVLRKANLDLAPDVLVDVRRDMALEFAQQADFLMEAVVRQDKVAFLDRLGIHRGSADHEEQFNRLQQAFEKVLSAPDWVAAVQDFCTLLLRIPEIQAEMEELAAYLVAVGKAQSAEEELKSAAIPRPRARAVLP